MSELDKRIKNLEPVEGSECPTCGQPLKPADREKLIATSRREGKILGDTYRKNQGDLKVMVEVIANLEKDIQSQSHLDESLRDITRAHDQLESRIEQIKQQQNDWSSTGAPRLGELNCSLNEKTYAKKHVRNFK